MTVASTYMIKELTAKFGRWAVDSFGSIINVGVMLNKNKKRRA